MPLVDSLSISCGAVGLENKRHKSVKGMKEAGRERATPIPWGPGDKRQTEEGGTERVNGAKEDPTQAQTNTKHKITKDGLLFYQAQNSTVNESRMVLSGNAPVQSAMLPLAAEKLAALTFRHVATTAHTPTEQETVLSMG